MHRVVHALALAALGLVALSAAYSISNARPPAIGYFSGDLGVELRYKLADVYLYARIVDANITIYADIACIPNEKARFIGGSFIYSPRYTVMIGNYTNSEVEVLLSLPANALPINEKYYSPAITYEKTKGSKHGSLSVYWFSFSPPSPSNPTKVYVNGRLIVISKDNITMPCSRGFIIDYVLKAISARNPRIEASVKVPSGGVEHILIFDLKTLSEKTFNTNKSVYVRITGPTVGYYGNARTFVFVLQKNGAYEDIKFVGDPELAIG